MKTSSLFHKYKEIVLGAAMAALSVFYLYHSTTIKVRSSVSVSAKLIPEILGVLVLVLGIFQVIAGVRYLMNVRQADRDEGNASVVLDEGEKRDFGPIVLTFALIIGYALVFEPLGFVISSTLCMFFQMLILSPRDRRRPLLFIVISFVVAVVVYIAFRKGLNLSLPQGVLEGLPL